MIFYTTPSGDNSANEVARINSSGNFLVGQTNASFGTAGHILALTDRLITFAEVILLY